MPLPSQFDKHTTSEEVADYFKSEIKGKNVLITGASPGGLGAAFAQAISRHSPGLVVLAGRSFSALETTQAGLLKETPGLNVRILVIDLGSLDSVRKAAAEVLAYDETIDINVLNAGVMATPEGKTTDGIETQFGVNHVGPFLFANLLLEEKSPQRTVVISSAAQRYWPGGINFEKPGYVLDDDKSYEKWTAYGQSKAANVLFAAALHRRGREAVSLHPGVIKTPLLRHMTEEELRGMGMLNEDGTLNSAYDPKSLSQGAATHVVAAFAPASDLFPVGAPAPYLEDCQLQLDMLHETAKGVDREKQLWKLSEELVGCSFTA